MRSLRGNLDHRQDAGLDRLGQLGPGFDHGGKIRVTLTSVGGQWARHLGP